MFWIIEFILVVLGFVFLFGIIGIGFWILAAILLVGLKPMYKCKECGFKFKA